MPLESKRDSKDSKVRNPRRLTGISRRLVSSQYLVVWVKIVKASMQVQQTSPQLTINISLIFTKVEGLMTLIFVIHLVLNHTLLEGQLGLWLQPIMGKEKSITNVNEDRILTSTPSKKMLKPRWKSKSYYFSRISLRETTFCNLLPIAVLSIWVLKNIS